MDIENLLINWMSLWVKDILNFIFNSLSFFIFSPPENSFINQTMSFFCWFTSVFAVVIVGYKILEYIINTQNGTQEIPLSEIFLRLIKSASCLMILPWISKLLLVNVALPVTSFFTSQGFEPLNGDSYEAIKAFLLTFQIFSSASSLIILLFEILFLLGFLFFFSQYAYSTQIL